MQIPIFPLNTVLFPGGILPLRIFETRYMDMTRDCMKQGSEFGVSLIREGREVGAPAMPMIIGCTAGIIDWDMEQLGVLNIRTEGRRRFRLLSSAPNSQGLLIGDVEFLADDPGAPVPVEHAECVKILRSIVEKHGAEVLPQPHRFDDSAWVSYRLSEIMPMPSAGKQKLLEVDDHVDRLEILQRLIARASKG